MRLIAERHDRRSRETLDAVPAALNRRRSEVLTPEAWAAIASND